MSETEPQKKPLESSGISSRSSPTQKSDQERAADKIVGGELVRTAKSLLLAELDKGATGYAMSKIEYSAWEALRKGSPAGNLLVQADPHNPRDIAAVLKLARHWGTLDILEVIDIITRSGGASNARAFLEMSYRDGTGNKNHTALSAVELLEYLRSVPKPTSDGLRNFAVELRRTAGNNYEVELAIAKARGDLAARISGEVLGSWLTIVVPELIKSGYSVVELARIKAANPELSAAVAVAYLEVVKGQNFDVTHALELLAACNNNLLQATSALSLVANGYKIEDLKDLRIQAEAIGIKDLGVYLRGVNPHDARRDLQDAANNEFREGVSIADRLDLSLDRYTLIALRNGIHRSVNRITERALSILVDSAFDRATIAEWVRDPDFSWGTVEKAFASPIVKIYFIPEFSRLIPSMLSLGVARFESLYAVFSKDSFFKNEISTPLFIGAIVNYGMQYPDTAADVIASKVTDFIFNLGTSIGRREALAIAVITTDFPSNEIIDFVTAMHAQRPDFFNLTKDFSGFNMLHIYVLARQDGDFARTFAEVAQLEKAGFTPFQICQLAGARKNLLRLKGGTPSFSVLVNDVLAYKRANPGASNDVILSSIDAVYENNIYVTLSDGERGIGPVPKSFVEALRADTSFVQALAEDPLLAQELFVQHTNPADIIAIFALSRRSGLAFSPREMPVILCQAGGPMVLETILFSLNKTSLTAAQKYDVLGTLLLFKRSPSYVAYLDVLNTSGLAPSQWANQLITSIPLEQFAENVRMSVTVMKKKTVHPDSTT